MRGMIGYNPRLKPGAIIDCDDPKAMSPLLYDKDMIASLKAESGAFVDLMAYALQPMYIRHRVPFTYEKPKPKGWGAYEWVGFWNYALLGTATVLAFLLLHLGGLF